MAGYARTSSVLRRREVAGSRVRGRQYPVRGGRAVAMAHERTLNSARVQGRYASKCQMGTRSIVCQKSIQVRQIVKRQRVVSIIRNGTTCCKRDVRAAAVRAVAATDSPELTHRWGTISGRQRALLAVIASAVCESGAYNASSARMLLGGGGRVWSFSNARRPHQYAIQGTVECASRQQPVSGSGERHKAT